MAIPLFPTNWYWIVPEFPGQVYSSLSDSYVSNLDLTFIAWKAALPFATPSTIASATELQTVLALYNLPYLGVFPPAFGSYSKVFTLNANRFIDNPIDFNLNGFAIANSSAASAIITLQDGSGLQDLQYTVKGQSTFQYNGTIIPIVGGFYIQGIPISEDLSITLLTDLEVSE